MQSRGYAGNEKVYTADFKRETSANQLLESSIMGSGMKNAPVIAITHVPSPRMKECVRTFVGDSAIDMDLARRQHAGYCAVLEECGAEIVRLDANVDLPDAVFVEDAAIALNEMIIVGAMGVESRKAETAAVVTALRNYHEVKRINPPATLEGGDVLRAGRTLLVGKSSRTNEAGISQLRELVEPLGYRVRAVPVHGCLHLKTGCCALPDGALLVNRKWIDCEAIGGFELIDVPGEEPWAANVALIRSSVIVPANHVRTAEKIARRGFEVHGVDISEFQKAEGGVTCLSILVEQVAQ